MQKGIEQGMQKGIEQGIEKGIAEEAKKSREKLLNVAIELIKIGLNNDAIAQATGLTEAEIEKLKSDTPSV